MRNGPSPGPDASGLAEVRAISYFIMRRGRGSLIFLEGARYKMYTLLQRRHSDTLTTDTFT